MAFIDDVKKYSHAESAEDADVQSFINSAEAYLTGAGIKVAEDKPLYGLAVKMLVSQWYDNRTTKPESENSPQARGLDGIIFQLQTGGDSDAGG